MTDNKCSFGSDGLRQAVLDIIEANNDFRAGMPADWEGDPLQDAINAASGLLLDEARTFPVAQASWQPMSALPDIGRKFICLYSDGSGAVMFWRHNDGYIDQDGDDCNLERGQYDRWAYLPDELEFWCETRGEDPMCLALPSTDRPCHGPDDAFCMICNPPMPSTPRATPIDHCNEECPNFPGCHCVDHCCDGWKHPSPEISSTDQGGK